MPSSDIISSLEGIYDADGTWIETSPGVFVQLLNHGIDSEVVKFVAQNTTDYTWSDTLMGIRPPDSTPVSSHERDRLTGYALDDGGGYRVPVVLDGAAYAPRFYSCATPECLISGANIDLSDAANLKWIKTSNAKALDDVGFIFGVAGSFSSGGALFVASNVSLATDLLAGYLNDDFSGAVSEAILSAGFQKYAVQRGVSDDIAGNLSNMLSVSGVWRTIVSNGREFVGDE